MPLTPNELGEQDFIGFFRDSSSSWRPYAAKLPWMRDPEVGKKVLSYLRELDVSGSGENRSLISPPSRALVEQRGPLARLGICQAWVPALVVRPVPFLPDALPVANFLSRVHAAYGAGEKKREHPLKRQRPTLKARVGTKRLG